MAQTPSFESTTKLVARALGIGPEDLLAGFRAATTADLDEIVAFRRAHIGEQIIWDDATYLSWRYHLGDPQRGLGKLWMLTIKHRLVGIVGTEILQLQGPARTHGAVRTMDILIDPSATNSGLGVWLNQALFDAAQINLAVGANSNSIGTVSRLYHKVKPRQDYVHVLDFRSFPMGKFRVRAAASLLRLFGNPIMTLWRMLIGIASRSVDVRPISVFSPEPVDAMVRGATCKDSVDLIRSADFLNRRIVENPRVRYTAVGAYAGPHLIGYAAWRLVTDSQGGCWMYVLDILPPTQKRRRRVTCALLAAVLRQSKTLGCSHVNVTTQRSDWRMTLIACGFFRRKTNEFRLAAIRCADADTLAKLQNADWKMTELCSDQDGF
jgi:hypothetical protein